MRPLAKNPVLRTTASDLHIPGCNALRRTTSPRQNFVVPSVQFWDKWLVLPTPGHWTPLHDILRAQRRAFNAHRPPFLALATIVVSRRNVFAQFDLASSVTCEIKTHNSHSCLSWAVDERLNRRNDRGVRTNNNVFNHFLGSLQ
jgi:hypothetical protein